MCISVGCWRRSVTLNNDKACQQCKLQLASFLFRQYLALRRRDHFPSSSWPGTRQSWPCGVPSMIIGIEIWIYKKTVCENIPVRTSSLVHKWSSLLTWHTVQGAHQKLQQQSVWKTCVSSVRYQKRASADTSKKITYLHNLRNYPSSTEQEWRTCCECRIACESWVRERK